MNTVDLHVHSNKSDGSFTPSELVDMAIAKGLTAFALTDHDTTAGVKEAVAYGQEKGIEVIPGIEFSTEYYGKDIIVGLFIDEMLRFQSRSETLFVRAKSEMKKCAPASLQTASISATKLLEAFPDCVITRGHYSRYLLDHGYVKSLPEAFDRYLGDHTKYFVPGKKSRPPRRFPDSRRQGHPGSRPSDALPYGKG